MARVVDAKASIFGAQLRPCPHIGQMTVWDSSQSRGELQEGECDPHPLLLTGGNDRVATNTRTLPEDYIHNVCMTTIRVFGSSLANPKGVTTDSRLPPSVLESDARVTDCRLVTDPVEVTHLLRDCVFRTLLSGFGVAPVEPISLAPGGGVLIAPRMQFQPSVPKDSARFATQLCQFLDRCAKNGLVCLGEKTLVEWDEKNQSILVRDMRECHLAFSRQQWNEVTLKSLQARVDPAGNKKVAEWKAKLTLRSMETPGQLAQTLIFL